MSESVKTIDYNTLLLSTTPHQLKRKNCLLCYVNNKDDLSTIQSNQKLNIFIYNPAKEIKDKKLSQKGNLVFKGEKTNKDFVDGKKEAYNIITIDQTNPELTKEQELSTFVQNCFSVLKEDGYIQIISYLDEKTINSIFNILITHKSSISLYYAFNCDVKYRHLFLLTIYNQYDEEGPLLTFEPWDAFYNINDYSYIKHLPISIHEKKLKRIQKYIEETKHAYSYQEKIYQLKNNCEEPVAKFTLRIKHTEIHDYNLTVWDITKPKLLKRHCCIVTPNGSKEGDMYDSYPVIQSLAIKTNVSRVIVVHTTSSLMSLSKDVIREDFESINRSLAFDNSLDDFNIFFPIKDLIRKTTICTKKLSNGMNAIVDDSEYKNKSVRQLLFDGLVSIVQCSVDRKKENVFQGVQEEKVENVENVEKVEKVEKVENVENVEKAEQAEQTQQTKQTKQTNKTEQDNYNIFCNTMLSAMKKNPCSHNTPKILYLGLGCGVTAKTILNEYPKADITGVELHKQVIDIGIKYFDLDPRIHIEIDEAIHFITELVKEGKQNMYDYIVVDIHSWNKEDKFINPPADFIKTSVLKDVKTLLVPNGSICIPVLTADEHTTTILKVLISHMFTDVEISPKTTILPSILTGKRSN